jgi:hypothetical protein
MQINRCWYSLAGLVACTFVVASAHADAPTGDALMKDLGFSKADIRKVRSGEVVVRSLERIAPNQITAAAVFTDDIPLSEVMEQYSGGRSLATSKRLIAMGRPGLPIDEKEWAEAVFSESEMGDVEVILGAAPGLDLNLSTMEIAELRARLQGVSKADRIAAVSEAYRSLLQQRFRAYVEGGLSAVAGYDRGDGERSSPADGIQLEWEANREFLLRFFPVFTKAVDRYPDDQPPAVLNEIFWVKENFESKFGSRVAFLLEHHAWQTTGEFAVVSVRQFFVGHTYTGQQSIGLALPFEDHVMVFNIMSVPSDLIARYVPMIALPIGERMMRSELQAYLANLAEQTEQEPAP